MLHEHTLVVPRHDHNLLHIPVKDCLDFCSGGKCDCHTVVERKLEVCIDRMETLAEMIHDRPVSRPWKLAFVSLEFLGKSVVDWLALGC